MNTTTATTIIPISSMIPSTSSTLPPPPPSPILTSTTTTTTIHHHQYNITLDARIWRHLPLPLLDRILAFLPPPAFFRSLSLSKRFFSLPFSDSFLHLHLHLHLPSPLHPSFLFFFSSSASPNNPSSSSSPSSYPSLLLFSPSSSSWHQLPLPPFIPPSSSPSASSNGLLLFLSSSPGPKSLFLFNPLSKIASQLPPSPHPRLLPSVGISVSTSSLTIVLAGDDMISPFAVKNLTSETLIADAATGFFSPWTTISPLPRLCSLEPGRMIFSRGKFYCMSSAPFTVMVYDVGLNEWGKVQAPMRRFLRSPSLVTIREKVVMVAAVEKRKLHVPKSVRVWEMEEEEGGNHKWVEVDKMPPEFYRQFEEAEWGRGFECVSSGEYVAVTIKGSTDVMVFDYRRKDWRWAPHCRFLDGSSVNVGGGGLRGLGYEPRLATPALGLIDSASLAFQG